jgi:hypothetical protein
VRIPNDNGARYGLIDHLGTWVLKPEYEHLDPQLRLNMWIVSGRKDNLQGIFLLKEDPFWLISCKYDSIEILDPERGRNFFSFILESKSLYGLKLYPEHRAWGIPPFFKYKTTGAEMICRQTLYLMYEGERFLGYADKSGRYYFED